MKMPELAYEVGIECATATIEACGSVYVIGRKDGLEAQVGDWNYLEDRLGHKPTYDEYLNFENGWNSIATR